MPTVHLVVGLIGSGKSTWARRLERELPALRFSLDEWIMTLFGEDAPDGMSFEWWSNRAERSTRMVKRMAQQALTAGWDVVLDCGFLQRQHRDEMRQWAHAAGARTQLHLVRADVEVRRERVAQRNRERGETFALVVTADMFDALPWEPPSDDELVGGRVIDT